MRRGEHTPEAVKRRKQLQRKKRRYMELRDELETLGLIPVEPTGAVVGAVRPDGTDRVDPATQGEQHLPALVGQAVRNGWAVPEEKKPRLVDEMVAIVDNPEESNKVKVAAFNALRQADQHQYERDNPEAKRGGGEPVQLSVNIVNVSDARDGQPQQAGARARGVIPQGEGGAAEDGE